MNAEPTLTVRWPTITATTTGRWVGRLTELRGGLGHANLGVLMSVVTVPISLAVYAWQLMPWVCRRYRISQRRITIQKGLSAVDGPSIGLGEFDALDIEVLPGQAWLHTGDLVFRRDGREVFRLPGVSRPEPFRQSCLAAQAAYQSIMLARQGTA
ncbi:MAG: PH domain-containing protein [Pirellulales bacterium]|nr:PH domain-containing protein [Pirellulales bacterium]